MTWIDALALVLIVISIAVLVASSIVHRRPKKMLAELIIEGITRDLRFAPPKNTDLVVTSVVTSQEIDSVEDYFQVNVTLQPRGYLQQGLDDRSILHGMMAHGASKEDQEGA